MDHLADHLKIAVSSETTKLRGPTGGRAAKYTQHSPSELTIRGGIEHIGDDLQEDLRIIESVGRDE